ncbi:hypothetical protein G5B38_07790 [Pseudohalocynthiibacter aestuariivivens]|nr:I78 family peptidase inhibitor [Pseudohalocynthiibacter aestuariivivens]QIE45429.1 hypothetical protein G5B38_07790 [Pseudohalocynthiibacter aestuariivivens]
MNRFVGMTVGAVIIAALGAFAWSQMKEKDTDDTCGARMYETAIGTPHSDHDFSGPDRPLRIIAPDSAVTLDHRLDRLNIDVDDQGVITRVWCG